MSLIGELSLRNVRSNFQRQTKKKLFDISLSTGNFVIKFLNPDICRTEKRHFYS